MAKFTDCKGQEWALSFTIAEAMRAKAELKVDLLTSGKGLATELQKVFGNVSLFVDFIWLLAASGAREAGREKLHFFEGLDGDALDAAAHAFEEAFANFSQPHARGPVKEMFEAMRRLETAASQKALEAMGVAEKELTASLKAMSPEKMIEQAGGLTFGGNTSTTAPGSSA